MSIKEKIIEDLKTAMKTGDTVKRDTLRMLDSNIKNVEIEKKKKDKGLSDQEIIEVVSRNVKQRRDSVEQYEKGERMDLADREKKEIEILSLYLPEQLSEEEVRKVVKDTINKTNAKSKENIGRVMGAVMGKLKGSADGNLVKKIVEEEL